MTTVLLDISVSLDGYVAGPRPTLQAPLGEGGELLHEWVFGLEAWRRPHGLEGGETNQDSDVVAEHVARIGATVMGRRMFSNGEGPWEDDPKATGWWGEEPPFRMPVFVVTHHARAPLVLGETTFTFVTEGVETAIALAREAAGDKDVAIAGGASVAQQALAAGLLDELQLHVVPLLLGGGTPLFGDRGAPLGLQLTRVVASPAVTHLRYGVSGGAAGDPGDGA
jgi:dihydrofolate reductase